MANLRRVRKAIGVALPGALRDLAGFAGIAAISYGAWQVYVPAGWIVAGALLLWLAIVTARKAAPPPPPPELG